MNFKEMLEKLTAWVDHYGMDEYVLNDFCNYYAKTYEEYMSLWHIVNDFKVSA